MLRLADLHKRYGDVVALDGCAFGVERGEIVGFLGPNGAGKTTTMRAIFGLVALDEGTVTWDGRPIDHETRLRFGYMPEERGLYPRMTVADQVAWFGRLHGLAPDEATRATDEWLARLDLGERKGSRVEELSHGNQQRAQLAAALVHSPELLVLDEPFAGLDPLGVENLAGLLAEQARAGVAVLFSSHQLDLVEDLCERAVIVDHGRVVLDGPIGELRKASRYRYLEVEVVGDRAWWRDRPGVSLVAERDGVVRLRLDGDVDLGELLDAARRAGRIERFTFEPPTLSEVFREAVRR